MDLSVKELELLLSKAEGKLTGLNLKLSTELHEGNSSFGPTSADCYQLILELRKELTVIHNLLENCLKEGQDLKNQVGYHMEVIADQLNELESQNLEITDV